MGGENTTDVIEAETWYLGKSDRAILVKSFPQTAAALPDAETLWGDFRDGVLRGDMDGYSGRPLPMTGGERSTTTTVSMTFSENDPTDLTTVTWGSVNPAEPPGGDPACAYTPSLTSPAAGDGIGFNYTAMPQGPNLLTIYPARDAAWGDGASCVSSERNPADAALTQHTAGESATRYPAYTLGKWG